MLPILFYFLHLKYKEKCTAVDIVYFINVFTVLRMGVGFGSVRGSAES